MTRNTILRNAVTVESARTNIPGNPQVAEPQTQSGWRRNLTNFYSQVPGSNDPEVFYQGTPHFADNLPIVAQLPTYDKFKMITDVISARYGSPTTCRPCSHTRRKLVNRAYELVGVELNPGPQKKVVRVVERVTASKPKAKKKSTKRMGNSQSSRPARSAFQLTSAPSAFGSIAPQSYFRQSSNAQRNTEQDARGSTRVSGCALLRQGVGILNDAGSILYGAYGGLGQSPTSVPYRAYYHLNPNNIDTRLTAVANSYQFYAFRKIRLMYVPTVATTTPGAVHMAIVKDPDTAVSNYAIVGKSTGSSSGSNSTLMDYDPSVTATIWQPASILYTHTGTRLWDTFQAGSDDIDDRIQASLICIVSNITGPVSPSFNATLGWIWMEYEIDFYIPGPPSN